MTRRCVSLLALLVVLMSSHAYAQDATRTFSDQHCTFSLPDDTWTWGQPEAVPKSLAVATNEKGGAIVLLAISAPKGARLDKTFIEGFESSFLKGGTFAKTGSKTLSFKGIPSYQLEVKGEEGRIRGIIRVFIARGFCYQVQIVSASGNSPDEAFVETTMRGFSFVKKPLAQPARPQRRTTRVGISTHDAYRFSRLMGKIAAGCFILIIIVVLLKMTVLRKKVKEVPVGDAVAQNQSGDVGDDLEGKAP